MLKRPWLLAGLLSLVTTTAFAAGTIPFSLSQQFDSLGKPLANCKFYTIQAGTTSTPQNAYQDSALTIPLPNPQTCDAAGRLPQMFIADGTIKARLTDRNGVTIIVADNIQVIGASSGGGGGGTVDPTTILTTGDIKVSYGTGVLSGFVRANGRTIGSATSGATERANADCQTLFQYLWGADANLAVSGGRGASAAADWAANKTITLPDWRGRALAGLDDMGNTAAGRLSSTIFGTSPIVLGAAGGSESKTLAANNIPTITASGSVTITSTVSNIAQGAITSNSLQGGPNTFTMWVTGSASTSAITSTGPAALTYLNSAVAFATTQPTMLATVYLKL
jgi:hypothetical protein